MQESGLCFNIESLKMVKYDIFKDRRGAGKKIISPGIINNCIGKDFIQRELYISESYKNVIRGMHFQTRPLLQKKVVFVLAGVIKGVVLDLRKESSTYLAYDSFIMDGTFGIVIPELCAWGFLAIGDFNTVLYSIDGVFSKENDCGIRWDSFGFDWGNDNPVVSKRDANLITLDEYISMETSRK